jgi:molecular chaperone Hsp33
MLRALGAQELGAMLREQGGAEITCHFCNERWQIAGAELRQLLGELTTQ